MGDTGRIVSLVEDDDSFADILRSFIGRLRLREAALPGLLADGDLVEVRRHAHQLRGSAGGYGYPGLLQLAAALEEACNAGDEPAIDAAMTALLAYSTRIRLPESDLEEPDLNDPD